MHLVSATGLEVWRKTAERPCLLMGAHLTHKGADRSAHLTHKGADRFVTTW